MVREIAESYRSLPESTAVYLVRTRKAAADAREQFAYERYGMSQNNVR